VFLACCYQQHNRANAACAVPGSALTQVLGGRVWRLKKSPLSRALKLLAEGEEHKTGLAPPY